MMKYIKMFFRRISKDLKQKELLPLKVLFFVHASTLFVLYPYLTIHMRELGINVEETAIMSAVTPVVAIIMPPLAGMLADKIGNFKLMLAISSGMGGGAALLLLLVPVGRVTVTFPARAELVIGCQGTSSVSSAFSSALKIEASQYSCDAMHPYSYDVEMRVETCGFVCDWLPENGSLPIKDALSYAVKVRTPSEETTEVYRYPLTASDIPVSSMTDQNSLRALTNNERYKSALRRISDTTLFFPADGMYSLNCKKSYENVTDFFCEFGSNETVAGTMSKFFLAKVMPLTEKSNELAALSAYMDGGYSKEFTVEGLSEVKKNKGNLTEKDMQDAKFSEATCFDYYSTQDQEVSVEVLLHQRPNENKTKEDVAVAMLLTGCSPRCLATTPRHRLCSNLKEQVELDISLTFWSYMAVRVFIGIIGGTAFAMFEGAVIAILREHEADYGLQRIYGSIGGMISSPLSGMLIDYASQGKGYTDFRPAFYLYAVLKVVSGALMMTINLEFKSPASNLMNDVVTVLKNVEIVALFVACFVLGTAWGYIESFLFWLLQDLGGSRSLMGITITVGGIAGIPLLVMSGPIIERIGHANVLFIGFLFYSVRLLGYSLIYNPWMCLIFEALEGVTSSLAFTAAVTYAARLSTTTTDTSIQGLLGGLYYGVGKGSGSLIGGYLMKAFGTRPTYQIFAGGTLVTGCAYYLFNKLYLMKRPQVEGNDICKKHPKIKNIEANDKIENGINSGRSEKMRLKEDKENVNLYLDNIPIKHIGINNQSYQVGDGDIDKIHDVINQNIILGDGMKNSKTNGLENPAFVDTESSGVRDRKRLGKGVTHADMENVKIESIGDIHNK